MTVLVLLAEFPAALNRINWTERLPVLVQSTVATLSTKFIVPPPNGRLQLYCTDSPGSAVFFAMYVCGPRHTVLSPSILKKEVGFLVFV